MKRLDQGIVAIATAAAMMSTTGCTDSAPSKAGGASPPVTLRIGTNDDPGAPAARAIEEFARQVTTRSHGQIRIEPVWQVGGNGVPGWDQVVARQVVNGPLDMGMIPARAWDTEKVTSLRALQAPFLVDSEGLLKQVVTADLAGQMLAGLDRAGVTGLALVPESTRHLFGYGKPLVSAADLHGKTIRVPRSTTSYAVFRALGAMPSDVDSSQDPFAGAESSFELAAALPRPATATGNLPLYAKANTVVINSKRFTALDQTQRDMLRDAAVATRDWGVRSMPSTAANAKRYCLNGGSVALATPAEVATFRRAAQPVYTELQKDPQTATFIAGIRGLAARAEPSPPVAACGPAHAAAPAVQPAANTFPDGVYRKTVSEKVMLAGGVFGRAAKNHAGLWTMTFDKGTVAIQQRGYPAGTGVYCLSEGKVTVTEGRSRCDGTDGRVIFTATWHLDHNQLRFTPTGAVNGAPPGALTNTLFGGEPWTKIN